MKLQNTDRATLETIFGKEVFKLLKGHKATLALIKAGDMPAMDAQEMHGAVTGYDFQDDKGPVLALFINPEMAIASMNALNAADAATRQLILRGIMVHELTHVKQANDGRMVGDGPKCYWEGKEITQPATLQEYMLAPWEVEAYAAQISYVEGCTYEEAVDRYFTRNNLNVKQAA